MLEGFEEGDVELEDFEGRMVCDGGRCPWC